MTEFSSESHSSRVETSSFANLRRSIVLVLAGVAGGYIAGHYLFPDQKLSEDKVSTLTESVSSNTESELDVQKEVDTAQIEVRDTGTAQSNIRWGIVRESVFDQAPEDFVDPSQCRVLSFVVQGRIKSIEEMRKEVTEADEKVKLEVLEDMVRKIDWNRLYGIYDDGARDAVDHYKALIDKALENKISLSEIRRLQNLNNALKNAVNTNPDMESLRETIESVQNIIYLVS